MNGIAIGTLLLHARLMVRGSTGPRSASFEKKQNRQS